MSEEGQVSALMSEEVQVSGGGAMLTPAASGGCCPRSADCKWRPRAAERELDTEESCSSSPVRASSYYVL